MRRYLLILATLLVPAELSAQSDPRAGCDNFQGQAMAGDVAGLEQALALGVDMECKQSIYANATAVILAARGGHAGAVRLLLQRGANVNARDGSGWTALRHARQVFGALPRGTPISRNLELVIEALRSANAQE